MKTLISFRCSWPIGAASALLLILFVWVGLSGYPTFNEKIFLAINALGVGGSWFWQNLTSLGEGLIAFVLLACFSRRNGHFIWTLLLAAAIAGISVQLLKQLFAMPRPAAILEPGTFNLIGAELRARAFPSGHATTALVAACLATMRFPRFRLPIYTLCIGVALSRMIVGAHWPFDILAGGCLGYLSGKAAGKIANMWSGGEQKWMPLAAWILLLVLSLWLVVFPLDYPAARTLTLIVAAAGIAVALLNLRSLLAK